MSENEPHIVQIIGCRWCPRTFAAATMLSRNLVPYEFVAVETPEEAGRILGHATFTYDQLPILSCDKVVLFNPTEELLAEHMGMTIHPRKQHWDLIIVGAGPAGLSAAVYAASEGLSVTLLERQYIGGQAGLSARIENYLGFDEGISGAELANRAMNQVHKFGADIVSPRSVSSVRVEESYKTVILDDGSCIGCQAMLLAMGVTFRRLSAPGIEELIGRGIYYSAPMSEALKHEDDEVFIVGGANSAGQAAVALATKARQVTMIVRGNSLEESMSKYLVDSIHRTPNIVVLLQSEVTEAKGSDCLEALKIRDGAGEERWYPATVLNVYIGAVPHTDRFRGLVELDDYGFVRTGFDSAASLQTNVPGIFAAGDVRSGSTKRVATAVGEGCMAIAQVQSYLISLGIGKVPAIGSHVFETQTRGAANPPVAPEPAVPVVSA